MQGKYTRHRPTRPRAGIHPLTSKRVPAGGPEVSLKLTVDDDDDNDGEAKTVCSQIREGRSEDIQFMG